MVEDLDWLEGDKPAMTLPTLPVERKDPAKHSAPQGTPFADASKDTPSPYTTEEERSQLHSRSATAPQAITTLQPFHRPQLPYTKSSKPISKAPFGAAPNTAVPPAEDYGTPEWCVRYIYAHELKHFWERYLNNKPYARKREIRPEDAASPTLRFF